MLPLLIKNARFLDPGQKIDRTGSMLLRDGRIVWWGGEDHSPSGSRFDVLEAQGLVVCPGFIDLHCHLRTPGFEEKETIATGTQAALRGGFTTVCCMPNTRPTLDNVKTIELVNEKIKNEALVRVLPIACVSKNREGKELTDMEALASAGVAGFSDDGDPVRDNHLMRQALEMSKKLGLPIIDHCEEQAGGPPEGEVRMVSRDLELASETGGWVHIAHVSVAGATGLIQAAKEKGMHVTAEVTPHHLTLTQDVVRKHGAMAKVNPPLRTETDRVTMVRALKEGIIDCIATDHAPHTETDKKGEYARAASGISGFETAFGSLMSLVHSGQLTLQDVIFRLTAAPAKILGQRANRQGCLLVGAVVDIIIIDPDKEWTVDASTFASRGKNTPLHGTRMKGKVVATLPQGQLKYLDESLQVCEDQQTSV